MPCRRKEDEREALARWRHPVRGDVPPVNASPRELERDDYVDAVEQLLARTGLPAQALVLEVTESAWHRCSSP